ncbi:MAG TPA: hypothetical protein VJ553_04480 [Candidatus Paceibacterota bacterium]|nr:hypothetical protein [Candidatus Paceibacterota bacterium]
MDEQRTDAAGQAVALGEDIISELRHVLDVEIPQPAPTVESALPVRQRAPGAQSVGEAVSIAKQTLSEYEAILEDQRKQVGAWLEKKQEARNTDVEQRIAAIKARLNQPQ